jgi:hypothetical protein
MTDDMSTKPTDEESSSSRADTSETELDAGEESSSVAAGGTSENVDTAPSTTATPETPAGNAGETPAGSGG